MVPNPEFSGSGSKGCGTQRQLQILYTRKDVPPAIPLSGGRVYIPFCFLDTNMELNAAVNPQPTRSSPRLSWDQYLKLAVVPYAFGFLTVMFHTARFGFPVVQILEPLNFWVGLIPSLLLLIAWKGFSFVISAPWEKHMLGALRSTSSKKTARIMPFVGLGFFVPSFFILYKAMPHWSAKDVSPKYEILYLVALCLMVFAISFFEVGRQLSPDPKTPKVPQYMRIMMAASFSLMVILIFLSYLIDIYASMPQRYGFGKPSNVRLITDRKDMPPMLLEDQVVSLGAPAVSRSVRLLYKTAEDVFVLCDACDGKALSLRSSIVIGIVWEDAPKSAAAK